MRGTGRRVTRKVLVCSVAVSVVLFVVAAPFGHSRHGVGLVMSDVFWPLFLISMLVLIILALIAAVQRVMVQRSRRQ
jgi:hypothetical protein